MVHDSLLRALLILGSLLVLPQGAVAGIISVGTNGKVDSYTTNGGVKVYFHQGSFDEVNASVGVTSWPDAYNLALEVENAYERNNLLDLGDHISQTYVYIFHWYSVDNTATSVDPLLVLSPPGTSPNLWDLQNTDIQKTALTHDPSSTVITWASLSSPPVVPEPSTAIAMGLLGVFGFAGSRRRRRQS